jgi:hypothetical protein
MPGRVEQKNVGTRGLSRGAMRLFKLTRAIWVIFQSWPLPFSKERGGFPYKTLVAWPSLKGSGVTPARQFDSGLGTTIDLRQYHGYAVCVCD